MQKKNYDFFIAYFKLYIIVLIKFNNFMNIWSLVILISFLQTKSSKQCIGSSPGFHLHSVFPSSIAAFPSSTLTYFLHDPWPDGSKKS